MRSTTTARGVTCLLAVLACACSQRATRLASPQAGCNAAIGLVDPERRPVEVMCGDYRVSAATDAWTPGRHYKIFGNLIVPSGKSLDIRNSLVEIVSDYPRQHVIFIEGGSLSTADTQIGGTAREGVFVQTIVNIERGEGGSAPRWTLTNTVVQYSYGILHNAGTLEAWNLQGGPSPDAIILGGASTATLHGGRFAIAVSADARSGGDSVLDLPSNRPLTAVYSGEEPPPSGRRIPGMPSRLELNGTTVPMWFLFLRNVTTTASLQTTIRLRDVQSIVPAIQAVDFDGEMRLRSTWINDQPRWLPTLPAATVSTAGNLVVRTETAGTALPGWAVYLASTRQGLTRAIIRGPTSIAELFTGEGTRAEVLGTPGTFDTHVQATTIEMDANSSILARNVAVGWVLDRGTRGHIGANEPGAVVRFEHARFRDLGTLSHSRATVLFADSEPFAFADGSRATVQRRGKPPDFVRSALTAVSPAAMLRSDLRWAGMRVRIGRQPLRVTRLGRYRHAGNAAAHELRLCQADGRVIARLTVRASPDTDHLGFNYASLQAPIMLEPDTDYIIVSREGGGDDFADDTSLVTPRSDDLTVVGAVSSADGAVFQPGRAKGSYGPVNFQYVDERTRVR